MARLSTRARKALPRSRFALPGGTKVSKAPAFPVNDREHAEKALQLVTRSLRAGHISASQAATVRRRANAVLGKKAAAKKAAAKRR